MGELRKWALKSSVGLNPPWDPVEKSALDDIYHQSPLCSVSVLLKAVFYIVEMFSVL